MRQPRFEEEGIHFSIIFLNIIMSFYGFATSYSNIDLEWAKITLCSLWVGLVIAASLNQGNIYKNLYTKVADIVIAVGIMGMYTYLYWNSMQWYHKTGGVLAATSYLSIRIFVRTDVGETQNLVNLWHIVVITLIFMVPYSLKEDPIV
tara:strand:- start:1059 stop:1502 length:444 start_codon:yes stop_codon:yes gene_type:complete